MPAARMMAARHRLVPLISGGLRSSLHPCFCPLHPLLCPTCPEHELHPPMTHRPPARSLASPWTEHAPLPPRCRGRQVPEARRGICGCTQGVPGGCGVCQVGAGDRDVSGGGGGGACGWVWVWVSASRFGGSAGSQAAAPVPASSGLPSCCLPAGDRMTAAGPRWHDQRSHGQQGPARSRRMAGNSTPRQPLPGLSQTERGWASALGAAGRVWQRLPVRLPRGAL